MTKNGPEMALDLYAAGMEHEEAAVAPDVADRDERTLRDEELADLVDVENSPARVTFSTQDMSVDALVKRLDRRSMLVPQFGAHDNLVQVPGFQRGFVWSKAQMDQFIESLLLGYPVPGIFLIKQDEDNRMLILDGQQRLITLQSFYAGEFSLQYVGREFKGLTYKTLDDSLQFKLDDSYMQATIVAADGSDEVNDSIFQIFERLNSGGTQLTAHEIRVALYAGNLVTSIERLNENQSWRRLFGARSKRLRDHELITRILALFTDSTSYRRPLKSYLNSFVREFRTVEIDQEERGQLFLQACEAVDLQIGPRAYRREGGSQVNTAQAEAIMVALMEVIQRGTTPENLPDRFASLIENQDFLKHTGRATADKDAVDTRLRAARTELA